MFVGLSIQPELAGTVLSFLGHKGAIFYILLYKKTHGNVNFIPKDFVLRLYNREQLRIFKKCKDIENLDCKYEGSPYWLHKFINLRSLTINKDIYSCSYGLGELTKLKELNTTNGYFVPINIDHLHRIGNIEKYKGFLIPLENSFSFNLVEFEGTLSHVGIVSLTKYFDPTKLKKLIISKLDQDRVTDLDLFTELEDIEIDVSYVSKAFFKTKKKLVNLHITNNPTPKTVLDLSLLSDLPNLKKLSIDNNSLTPGENPPIEMLGGLETLIFRLIADYRRSEYIKIFELTTNLKYLRCFAMDSILIECLPISLVSLEILVCIRDSARVRLKNINRLVNLESLKMGNINEFRPEPPDLVEIAKLPKLKTLDIKISTNGKILLMLKSMKLDKLVLNEKEICNPKGYFNNRLPK